MTWTAVWVALALLFNGGLWHFQGSQKMDKFHHLKVGLGVVLAFVGVRMLLAHTAYKIDTRVSLGVVVLSLAVSVVASLLRPKRPLHFAGPSGLGVLRDGGEPAAGAG
jgi:predicted tellurium resistance membrane protein TerC